MPLQITTQDEENGTTKMILSLEVQQPGIVRVNGKDHLNRVHQIGNLSSAGLELQDGIPTDSGWPLTPSGRIIITNP